MKEVWATIIAVSVVSFALKAAGPVVVGGRPLPDWLTRVIALLAPALLAALVMVDTFADGQSLVIDARVAGLAAAAVCVVLRAPLLVTVVGAAAATAVVRALGG
jgi:branched-subunit amino acid transport protein